MAATVPITRLYHCNELPTERSSSLLDNRQVTLTELDPLNLQSLLPARARFRDLRVSSFGHWRQLYCQLRLDETTCPPVLLVVCEREPEEVDDHERQYRRPRVVQVQLTILQSRVQLRTQARSKSANMCSLRLVCQEAVIPVAPQENLVEARALTTHRGSRHTDRRTSANSPHVRNVDVLTVENLYLRACVPLMLSGEAQSKIRQ